MSIKNKKMTPVNLNLEDVDGCVLQQPDVKKWIYQLRVIEDFVLADRSTKKMLQELHSSVNIVKILNASPNVTRKQRKEIVLLFCNIAAILGMRNSLSYESIIDEVGISIETFDRIIGNKVKSITAGMAELFVKLHRGEIEL